MLETCFITKKVYILYTLLLFFVITIFTDFVRLKIFHSVVCHLPFIVAFHTKSAHLLSSCVTTRVSVCKALALSDTFSSNIDVEGFNNAL